MRAIAALIVVIFHAQGELRHHGFADPFPDLTVGAFGVDLFFVVSGFIMVHASRPLFGRARVSGPFLWRRVARVAPLYWLFTAAFAVIVVILSYRPGHAPASATHIVASFLFLPALRPEDAAYFPVYSLGWTLNYEMFFYVCFALALGFRRGLAVPALSAALLGFVAVGRLVPLPWPLFYWANPIILELVFGLWIGTAHEAGLRLPTRPCSLLAPAAVAAVGAYAPHVNDAADWRGLAWGLPAAALVAFAIGVPFPGTSPPARAAIRIGDASYSLYLVHSALFLAAFGILSQIVDLHRVPPAAYAAALVAASVAAALALFRWFETPVTGALQGLQGRRPAASTRVTE